MFTNVNNIWLQSKSKTHVCTYKRLFLISRALCTVCRLFCILNMCKYWQRWFWFPARSLRNRNTHRHAHTNDAQCSYKVIWTNPKRYCLSPFGKFCLLIGPSLSMFRNHQKFKRGLQKSLGNQHRRDAAYTSHPPRPRAELLCLLLRDRQLTWGSLHSSQEGKNISVLL